MLDDETRQSVSAPHRGDDQRCRIRKAEGREPSARIPDRLDRTVDADSPKCRGPVYGKPGRCGCDDAAATAVREHEGQGAETHASQHLADGRRMGGGDPVRREARARPVGVCRRGHPRTGPDRERIRMAAPGRHHQRIRREGDTRRAPEDGRARYCGKHGMTSQASDHVTNHVLVHVTCRMSQRATAIKPIT